MEYEPAKSALDGPPVWKYLEPTLAAFLDDDLDDDPGAVLGFALLIVLVGSLVS